MDIKWCDNPQKTYSKSGCQSCWHCQTCGTIGCDNFYWVKTPEDLKLMEEMQKGHYMPITERSINA